MKEVEFMKYTLISIEPWRDAEGSWVWNDMFRLEEGIHWDVEAVTPRRVLAKLRKWGYLSQHSKGRLAVEFVHGKDLVEIVHKNTREPIYALSAIH